ncbi:hypothetical protein BD770DRAFT_476203 [Pilaira anomala]|nr:hypothetical protein BD770DRAFT_476203 [Pilaira anomala]
MEDMALTPPYQEEIKKTIRSITIKQAKTAEIRDDTTHTIDHEEVYNVTLIGVVRSITKSDMFTSYTIEDGTGAIDVRKFQGTDKETETVITPKEYVEVHGRLRSFNNRNTFIVANRVSTRTMDQLYVDKGDNEIAKVKKAILECSNTESGAYIHAVVVQLKERMVESRIMKIMNDLVDRGEVYYTKDSLHLKLV